MAAELARTNPDVTVVTATAMPYLEQATANVPVVFGIGDDPVHAGYVASLAPASDADNHGSNHLCSES